MQCGCNGGARAGRRGTGAMRVRWENGQRQRPNVESQGLPDRSPTPDAAMPLCERLEARGSRGRGSRRRPAGPARASALSADVAAATWQLIRDPRRSSPNPPLAREPPPCARPGHGLHIIAAGFARPTSDHFLFPASCFLSLAPCSSPALPSSPSPLASLSPLSFSLPLLDPERLGARTQAHESTTAAASCSVFICGYPRRIRSILAAPRAPGRRALCTCGL